MLSTLFKVAVRMDQGAMEKMRRVLILLCLVGCVLGCDAQDWRSASRLSAHIAPDPAVTREAVVQAYAARTWGWRGWFAVHTWIAVKPSDGASYTVYELIGWRQRQGLPLMRIEKDLPDRYWYGERPRLLTEKRGARAEKLIPAIDKAARSYPWPSTYKAFPGPNSNTFTAWIATKVPDLGLVLPFTAIGSGFVK